MPCTIQCSSNLSFPRCFSQPPRPSDVGVTCATPITPYMLTLKRTHPSTVCQCHLPSMFRQNALLFHISSLTRSVLHFLILYSFSFHRIYPFYFRSLSFVFHAIVLHPSSPLSVTFPPHHHQKTHAGPPTWNTETHAMYSFQCKHHFIFYCVY